MDGSRTLVAVSIFDQRERHGGMRTITRANALLVTLASPLLALATRLQPAKRDV